ncbi:MAG: helix-turn-helix domain-containing protein [Streptosporangiaceae bacterium]
MDKALDLIEIVAGADRPLRLSEIADAAGLHRATAHRILADLLERAWVQRTDDRYLPGAAILRLSGTAAADSLAALAHPVLESLSARTGLMVNLQILEADRARVIDVVRPARLHMITHLRGEALPVHRFAGPLALVAALPPAARHPYLRPAEDDGHPMDALGSDLAAAEREGFALEHGRNDSLVASLSRAVPAAPLSALTLVGPDPEFSPAALPALRTALNEAAETLRALLTRRKPDS